MELFGTTSQPGEKTIRELRINMEPSCPSRARVGWRAKSNMIREENTSWRRMNALLSVRRLQRCTATWPRSKLSSMLMCVAICSAEAQELRSTDWAPAGVQSLTISTNETFASGLSLDTAAKKIWEREIGEGFRSDV